MSDPFSKRHALLLHEMTQRREEGCDVTRLEADLRALNEPIADADYAAWWARLAALRPRPDFPYREPSDLPGIQALRPAGPRKLALPPDAVLRRKMSGAWLGRAAGCQLGRPVEGWPKAQIVDYLTGTGAYPLDDYFVVADHPDGLRLHDHAHDSVRGFGEMARDDDIDYTILGLHLLEKFGAHFTTADVAESWLSLLPFYLVYTAERVAYRNLVQELPLDQVPVWRNPYREWIGAQIRADGLAYGAAAWPEKAAEFAWRDARLSHVKNGIYGEMWAAAMIAAAFAEPPGQPSPAQIERVIQTGLSEIPADCRLAEAIRDVLAWRQQTDDWTQAWEWLDRAYGPYHSIHTINNAAVVALGLLWGEGDFSRTIAIAVMGGWDTDCNGATAGSVLGALAGADALPARWIAPLNDRTRSAVAGYDRSQFSDLAARSVECCRKTWQEPAVTR